MCINIIKLSKMSKIAVKLTWHPNAISIFTLRKCLPEVCLLFVDGPMGKDMDDIEFD